MRRPSMCPFTCKQSTHTLGPSQCVRERKQNVSPIDTLLLTMMDRPVCVCISHGDILPITIYNIAHYLILSPIQRLSQTPRMVVKSTVVNGAGVHALLQMGFVRRVSLSLCYSFTHVNEHETQKNIHRAMRWSFVAHTYVR